EAAKFDDVPEFRHDTRAGALGIAAAQEVLAFERKRNGRNAFGRVDAYLGFLEHVRGNVRGLDAETKARMRLSIFAEHHGQGIRFLSTGASCTPYDKGTAIHGQFGQRFLNEKFE